MMGTYGQPLHARRLRFLQTKVTAGVSPIDRNGHPRSQGLFPTQFSQFQLALTTLNNSNSNIAAQNSSRVNSCLLLDAWSTVDQL